MENPVTAYEKGLAFEQRLVQLFRSKGYEVAHNVQIVGRSGAQHQIDLLVRFTGPLHVSTIVVEAKSYQAAIDKDRIMKLIQIVDDLGADRGIIITTSHFTPAASKTAEGHNVELWDRDRLGKLLGELEIAAVEAGLPLPVEVLEQAVAPRFPTDEIERQLQAELEKKARGGFLGIGKVLEQADKVVLVYYPYYEAEVEWQVSGEQRVGLLKKEIIQKVVSTRISVDAAIGCPVFAAREGVSYAYLWLTALGADEIAVLKAVGREKFNLNILMALGFSEGKAKKLLGTLIGKGIVQKLDTRPASYLSRQLFPSDPRSLTAISEACEVREGVEAVTGKYGGAIKEASAIVRLLERYWTGAAVKNLFLLYYPYVFAVLGRPDGTRRVRVIDAVTRQPNETLERFRWET